MALILGRLTMSLLQIIVGGAGGGGATNCLKLEDDTSHFLLENNTDCLALE